jgi:LytS/YehU family sensor histidine kinase
VSGIKKWFNRIIMGFGAAFFGVLIMLEARTFDPLLLLDTRAALVALVGMFSGPVATAICAGVLIAARLLFGGDGMLAGILSMIAAGGLGVAWHLQRYRAAAEIKQHHALSYYSFGLATQILTLSSFLILPQPLRTQVIGSAFFSDPADLSVYDPPRLYHARSQLETVAFRRGAKKERGPASGVL